MKLKAYCGCFFGPSRWHNNDTYEPDECEWEDIIEVDELEYQEGFVCITCPVCNAELYQMNDHFEVIENNDESVSEV